jgi:hypothetical protein
MRRCSFSIIKLSFKISLKEQIKSAALNKRRNAQRPEYEIVCKAPGIIREEVVTDSKCS